MLTPVEIQNKTFKSGGLGYDKKEVEAYMHDISRNYEELYRQNLELKDKVSVLTEGIQYYKSIEKTLQKALVLAEKTADNKIAASEKEAKRIEKEARVKANIIVSDAKNELNRLHSQTVQLLEQYEKYRLQFKNLARTQMELIDSDVFNINIQNLDAFIPSNDIDEEKKDDKDASGIQADVTLSEDTSKEDNDAVSKPENDNAEEQEFLSDYSDEDFEDIDEITEGKESEDNIDSL